MARTALFDRLRHLVARAGRHPRGAGPSRREVVAGLGAALAAASASASLSGCDPGDADLRIVIVGGGLAGVTCAYRLDQAGLASTLYEASDRLGGRTWTGRDLYADGQVCELGGELIDTNFAVMWALAAELDIQLDDRLAPPFDALTPEVFHVGGAAVSEETLLAQLTPVLEDMISDYEAAESDDAAFEALDTEDLQAWLDRRVPVATAPELHAVLSAAYRGEFGLENDQQSALNFIYLFGLDDSELAMFGDSDERYHTHLGNDLFVTRMAERLPADAALTGHKLVRASGSGPFTLTFDTEAGEVEVEADKVVFALPYSVLREVDLTGLTISEDKRTIITTIGYGTNAKVMAGFTRPVWREDHDASGSATTDLAFQQCWDTSIGQAGPSAILTNFLGGEQGVESGEGTAESWVSEVLLPGLDAIWPGTAAAYVADSAVRLHWPTVPTHKGSYTCYLPGQWAFWSTEGEQEGDLHFCGEHTSADFQGWMEGGAESGQRVAEEILGDLGLELPATMARLAVLRHWMAVAEPHGGTPLRRLRARRAVLGAWSELAGRAPRRRG